jgi:hypothetical protein
MRVRALVATALLVLPAAAEAQLRIPRIRDRGPARPVPLPPTARPIAREMVYVRLPYSVESYPLISYFSAPGMGMGVSNVSSWTAGGAGTRLDYRLSRIASLTLDMTSTFIGGPAVTQTVELGTRLRPAPSESKWYPFVDLRLGYLNTFERETRPYDYVDPSSASSFSRMNHGIGAVAGTGVEYALHPRVTLTTAGTYMRTRVSPVLSDPSRPITGRHTMSVMRYSLGLRFNPGRWTMPANLPQQITR